MSTESNRKWARVDKRRERAHQLLESWINGNHAHVLQRWSLATVIATREPLPRSVSASIGSASDVQL